MEHQTHSLVPSKQNSSWTSRAIHYPKGQTHPFLTRRWWDKSVYLKDRNFRVGLFLRVISFYISCRFNFAKWLPVAFSRGLIFASLSFINVLYILIFSWFVLQLVVCESPKSHPNFSIFQIALFRYKRLNSW